VLKENYTGLGTGFTNFLSLERGQLVFRRSYLVPAKNIFWDTKEQHQQFLKRPIINHVKKQQ